MIALMPTDLQDGVASPWSSTTSASQSQPTGDTTDYGDESDDGSWDGVTTIKNDPWGLAASTSAQAQATGASSGDEQQSGGEMDYKRWGRRMVQL